MLQPPSLSIISDRKFDEIIVLGLSLEGVDLPYFKRIDMLTGKELEWIIYCYREDEGEKKKENLADQGISPKRITVYQSADFFDLKDDEMARNFLMKQRFDF